MNKIKVIVLLVLTISFFISCAASKKEETKKPDLNQAEKYVSDGFNHFKSGNDSLAVSAWQDALDIIPKDAEIHNFVGIAYHRMGKLNEASRAFKRAIDLDAAYYEAANNYGYLLFLLEKYPQAKKSFKLALKINPDYQPAKKNLELVNQVMTGSLAMEAFNYSEQAAKKTDYVDKIQVYERALNINPDYAKVHNNLGVALFYEGYFDSAYYHLEQAIRLQKDYPEAINNLGFLNRVDQKYDIAINLFLKALTIKPSYIAALNNLGEAYFLSKDMESAEKVFSAVLEMEETNVFAKKFLKKINKDLGE
ncbi:MAG: tetratricopeptide repeat protein [Calditrichaeota bacterium]|nr:MAG: tetratricopeptide repeat protein [Calditrichota bacterium]MBL1207558.1 tetratricopeptide repeat protein [Calditrichota bacterium]NOG47390.1 tetratricopeptide repeat protein [Calditrichota bacterium]